MAEKVKKRGNKFVAFLAIVALIGIGVGLYFFLTKNKTPNAVMECSVNPNVQFVLDTNNNVMQINYLNTDAEVLLKDADLVGKSAEDAANLFVKLSTEAGYIQVNTTGERVDIVFNCENAEDFTELKSKVVSKVNEYFDENGIIAGAVATVEEGFSDAIQKIGVSAQEIANKTDKEILALLNETSNNIKDVALELQDGLFAFIEQLKNSDAFKNIPTLEQTIDNLEDQINNSEYLPNNVKDQLKTQLNAAKDQLKKLQENLQKEIDVKIEQLKELSKEIYNNAKLVLDQKVESVKTLLQSHKQYVEQNQAAVQAAIQAYRDTLVA